MKNWRIHIVLFVIVLFGAAIIGRLVILQIVDHGFYGALAHGQQNFPNVVMGERGSIFAKDKNGELITLATNKVTAFVFISPPEIEDENDAVIQLSELLNISQDVLREKIAKKNSLFEILKKDITQNEEKVIVEAEIPGVYVNKEVERFYPQGISTAHLIGFVNDDGNGQYGIEEQYDEQLKGKEGIKSEAKNPGGYLLKDALSTPESGSDIVLTIDYNIQAKAEELLLQATESLEAEEGTVIVIQPTTGKILALANTPSFNPNLYSQVDDIGIFRNSAIHTIFEPGSIFKPITMSSAIDFGKVTPTTTYEDKGVLRIGGYKIENYDERIWGKRTMTEVLEYSINTGVVFAEEQLGHRNFLSAIERFNIFKPTGINLPGEVYSENKEFRKGYEINFATAAFGQGIEMTAMQMVKAFASLGNKGNLINPYIIESIAKDGVVTPIEHKANDSTTISPKTASQITSMLVSVLEHGYSKSARVPGYYIAGKTGTAQISYSALGISKSGYSEKTYQSFIGYGPAFNPEFLVLVRLKDPQTKTAEYSAIPVFQDLAKYIIDYYQIPPDY